MSNAMWIAFAALVVLAWFAWIEIWRMKRKREDIYAEGFADARRETAWKLQALDGAPVGIARVSRDHRFRFVNSEVERILGRTSEQLTGGMTWMDITHPDDVDRDMAQTEIVVSGQHRRYTLEKRYRNPLTGDVPVRICVASDPSFGDEDYLVYIEDLSKEKSQEYATSERLAAQADQIAELRARVEDLQQRNHELSARITRFGLEAAHKLSSRVDPEASSGE